MLLDGRLMARGEVVVMDGNYGLRVTEVAPAEPLRRKSHGNSNHSSDAWSLAWHGLWPKLAPPAGHSDCLHSAKRLAPSSRQMPGGVLMQGSRYCLDECLERALDDAERVRHPPRSAPLRIASLWVCCCFPASSSRSISCAPR